jgi:hypothetical protein
MSDYLIDLETGCWVWQRAKLCVNPDHLAAVTPLENVRRTRLLSHEN